MSSNNHQIAEAAQVGNEIGDDTLAQMRIGWIAGNVSQRQHRKRTVWHQALRHPRQWREGHRLGARRGGARRGRVEVDSIDFDRLLDILQLLLTERLQGEFRFVPHKLVDGFAYADAARISERLDPRRYIDILAVDAVLAGNGVADSDPDPVGEGFLSFGPCGFVRHFPLHFHGKMQRLTRARKQRDQPVTGGIHDGARHNRQPECGS